MNNTTSNIIYHIMVTTLIFSLVMYVFVTLDFISLNRVMTYYILFYIVSIISILLGQFIFGHMFLVSIELALIIEYVIYYKKGTLSSSYGIFLKTIIVIIGVIIGVTTQFVFDKLLKKGTKPTE